MPPRPQYALVTGGAYTIIEGNQYVGTQSSDEGMKILYEHACPGALHDSGERFDPPNCHPNTRVAVRNAIVEWLNDEGSEFVAMWMKGAMGAGKSSIAQTIAQLLHDLGQLSASFFFSRSSSSGRSDHTRLVATLAYQMSKEIPETRPFISSAVAEDHLVFKASLQTQLEALIMDSLSRIPPSSDPRPRLIIIDGLDECADRDMQDLIVKVFVSTLSRMKDKLQIPHRILIASRPEVNIEAAFRDRAIYSFVRQLPLDHTWSPDDDIRQFLVDSFAEIKLTHTLQYLIPDHWPPTADIDKLVQKSSGQFIYAAVVVRFLKSPRNHPPRCLSIIFGLVKDYSSRPYAELDALYAHIFSQVDSLDLIMRLLMLRIVDHVTFSVGYCEWLLDIPAGMAEISCTDLGSIVRIDDHNFLEFLHASLPEYLADKVRSGSYYVYSDVLCEDLARKCWEKVLQHTPNPGESLGECIPSYVSHSLDFIRCIMAQSTLDVRTNIYGTLSNTDIMFHYQSNVYPDEKIEDDRWCWRYITFGDFILWILNEYNDMSLSSSANENPLAGAFKNIQVWIQRYFKAFPLSGIDNENGWDLWIFSGSHSQGDRQRSLFLREISKVAVLGLGDKVSPSDVQRITDTIIPSIEPCLGLLVYLNRRQDVDAPVDEDRFKELLQEYAFTGTRYANATLKALRHQIFYKKSTLKDIPFELRIFLRSAGPDRSLCALLRSLPKDDLEDKLQHAIAKYIEFTNDALGLDALYDEDLEEDFEESDYPEGPRKRKNSTDLTLTHYAGKNKRAKQDIEDDITEDGIES